MRNSRVFRGLGIREAAEILKKSGPKATIAAREDSGSLYQPEDGEDVEQGVLAKVLWWQLPFMFNVQYMSKAQSFVLNMQNYLFLSNLC